MGWKSRGKAPLTLTDFGGSYDLYGLQAAASLVIL